MTMEYTHLGRSGLMVSRLCLGTMNFGPHTAEPESHAILEAALEGGINFIDTANVYGQQRGEGITENILGRWFAKGGGRRERVVLATKVYGEMGEGPNERRLSSYHLRAACEASLRRLQTDHIDLYQMHHIDRDTPWDEIWQAMEHLVQSGKILYVGSSNFAGWQIAHAQGEARARHFLGLVSEQSLYNLRSRSVELEVLPACRALGIGVLPWSPLSRGVLAGETTGQVRRSRDNAIKAFREDRAKLEGYAELCRGLGESPANVALAWLLGNSAVTAPIVGPRTVEQLTQSLRAPEIRLQAETLSRLDALWAGPGGEAPEAYAW